MAVILQPPLRRWQCPSCDAQHATRDARVITPMHACPRLGGLSAPYAEVRGLELEKRSVVHRIIERGDWIGKERGIPIVGGQAVMAIHTERADGHDTTVFAPTATAQADIR